MADYDRWRYEQERFGNRGDDRDRWRDEGNWRDRGRDERYSDFVGRGGESGGGFQRGRESGFGDYRRDFRGDDQDYRGGGYQGHGYESGFGGSRGARFGYGDMDRDFQGDFNRGGFGSRQGWSGRGFSNYGSQRFDRGGDYSRDYDRNFGSQGYRGDDRDFWDKASDEVSSWFGDDNAERRRRMDSMQAGEHRGRGPKGYTRSDDRIREDVSDRLTDDPRVDASNIEVMVSNGEVTLSGTITSRDQKRRAEDLAEMISGVKHVQNNLRVQEQRNTGQLSGQNATDVEVSSTGTSARRSA